MNNLLNNICNICAKKIDSLEIDYSITICKHVYHTSCLLNYMQKSYFCPKCRKELLLNNFEIEDVCENKELDKKEIDNKSNILFNLIKFR